MIALSHIFVGKVELPSDSGKKQIDHTLVHFMTVGNSARRMLNRISTNALPELNIRGFRSVMRCYKVTIHFQSLGSTQCDNNASLPPSYPKEG